MKTKYYNFGGGIQDNPLHMAAGLASLIPGPLGMLTSTGLGLIGGMVDANQQKKADAKKIVSATPGNYNSGGVIHIPPQMKGSHRRFKVQELATGGDIDLNSKEFQVKGNPQTTDGNSFNYKGNPVKLDHNEVVDASKDFVYSDSIINPLTNRSFAKDAAKLSRLKGNAEKLVKLSNSIEAKNTIKYLDKQSNDLRIAQETIAESQGLRNTSRQGFDLGGYLGKSIGMASQNLFGLTPEQLAQQGINLANRANHLYNSPVNTLGGEPFLKKTGVDTGDVMQKGKFNFVNQNIPGTSFPVYTVNRTVDPMRGLNPLTSVNATTTLNRPSSNSLKTFLDGFTAGDGMQALEVASKFRGTAKPAQVDTPYFDSTAISKMVYDPSATLNQNQQNYQNAIAGLNAPSMNLRRAFASNMLASKLNADSQTLDRYQDMNNQAKVQYEGRVSEQRRFNNQQNILTDDLNARNQARRDSIIDNAYTSVGNFGEALNRKKSNAQSLALLKELYPDVYDRIAKNLK